jgi:hypothetical protein
MMRLLVEYEVTDDYTYSYTVTIPVIYESAEAFLCILEQAVKMYIVEYLKYQKENEKYFDRRNLTGEIKIAPVPPNDELQLGKNKLWLSCFIDSVENKFSAPQVFTIDEFFKELEDDNV